MKNISLIGMPGSGKTTIGRVLSKKLGMKFIDLDRYIEEKAQMKITRIFEMYGEDYFRNIESHSLLDVLDTENTVISTGGGIVTREENMIFLKKKTIIFYIKRDLDIIINNVRFDNRPLLKDKNNLYKLFEKRSMLYEKYCDYAIVNDASIYDAVDKIIKILQED
ncbi:Shikimate kinase [Caloramator mitchellensis]|uniref:Shikimate kinase n=1 Tax=Caloramator mitchellensis TaxID=908809 RepID=A0A0R3JTK3_CALMK|nr:shikimate kinase [Caloramator mitchellensis]KRQ86849.1 Shikimate kinase [Caloramator mitchellensis]